MSKVHYHFDHVGSYLRPQALKEAREKFANGEISQDRQQVCASQDAAPPSVAYQPCAARVRDGGSHGTRACQRASQPRRTPLPASH